MFFHWCFFLVPLNYPNLKFKVNWILTWTLFIDRAIQTLTKFFTLVNLCIRTLRFFWHQVYFPNIPREPVRFSLCESRSPECSRCVCFEKWLIFCCEKGTVFNGKIGNRRKVSFFTPAFILWNKVNFQFIYVPKGCPTCVSHCLLLKYEGKLWKLCEVTAYDVWMSDRRKYMTVGNNVRRDMSCWRKIFIFYNWYIIYVVLTSIFQNNSI